MMSNHEQLQKLGVAIGLCAGAMILVGAALLYYALWIDHASPFVSHTVHAYDMSGVERYTYQAGEAIELRRDLCVSRTMPVQVGRQLRNEETNTGINIDSTSQVYKKGCTSGGNIIQLPKYTPPGRYRYVVTVRYPDNALRDEFAEFPTTYIIVVTAHQ